MVGPQGAEAHSSASVVTGRQIYSHRPITHDQSQSADEQGTQSSPTTKVLEGDQNPSISNIMLDTPPPWAPGSQGPRQWCKAMMCGWCLTQNVTIAASLFANVFLCHQNGEVMAAVQPLLPSAETPQQCICIAHEALAGEGDICINIKNYCGSRGSVSPH